MPTHKKSIIMIHGFRGTHNGLSLIARELEDKYDVFVPDIPGFGKGERLEHYSLDEYVLWLDRFIGKLNLSQPPVLLGHSFGSIISAAYAARFANKIDRLVLVNPIGAPALEGPRWFLTQMAVLYYEIGSFLPEKLARKWLSLNIVVNLMSISMAKTKQKSLRKYIHHQHRKYFSRFHDSHAVLSSFKTSINFSVKNFAEEISTPTLLIAGDLDDITPLNKQKELHKQFKNAKLEVIKGVGHLTHYEKPIETANIIDKWLS